MPLVNFSGLASGIDSAALIQATSEATRQVRVAPYEEQVQELEDANDAINELKTLMEDFRTQAQAFGTLSSDGIQKTALSSNETAVLASATSTATNGSYSVTVLGTAQNGVLSFNDRFSSEDAAIAPTTNDSADEADRTIDITIGTGVNQETVSIVIDSGTTASAFVSSFNQGTNKARANLVNVGTTSSPSYAITISSTETGEDLGNLAVSIGSELDTNNEMDNFTLSQATNASFQVSGINGTITRGTNSVADVLPGVTLELNATGSATVNVSVDTDATVSKIQSLVESYNKIITFIDENDTVERLEDGEEVDNIFGSLARTSVDDNALEVLRSALSSSSLTTGTTVRVFADLGISTARDGTLDFDSEELREAISEEPSSVEELLRQFADTHALTGQTLSVYTRFGGLFDLTLESQEQRITSLNDQISDAEAFIASREQALRAQYARLESTIGRLQGQQNALSSALAGLG